MGAAELTKHLKKQKERASMKLFLFGLILVAGCGSTPAVTQTAPLGAAGLPRILTIGDSITGNWNLPLSYMLKNEYNVTRITATTDPGSWLDNCRNTTYTLAHIDQWLTMFPNPKIITWNNGIWNAAQGANLPEEATHYYTPPDQYESELIQIAKKMKATGARVIFFTTTELSPSDTRATVGLNTQFNDIAKRVLPPLGVEVHDLWDFTIDHPEWHISPTDLHFNGIAAEIIADWIVTIVRGTAQ